MILAFLALAGCVGPWPGAFLKVDQADASLAFIYPGPVEFGGWSEQHHTGALEAAAEYNIPLNFTPSVDGIDTELAVEALIEENGSNIIYTPSSGYTVGASDLADKYPDKMFMSCCGQVSSDNLNSYFGRMYTPIYLLGFVAGKMSCTGHLGVTAALPLPEFVRHINAFTLGARQANPDVVVDVRWVGAFFAPQIQGDLAEELMDAGADVILVQSDSTEAVSRRPGATVSCTPEGETPIDTPVYRIGYHAPDACEANPDQCISSAYWNWGPLYKAQVGAILGGDLDPFETDWQPMLNGANSIVQYTTLASFVPATMAAELSPLREAAIANPQIPFVGPLRDNTGDVVIAAGDSLTDAQMDAICWFVDGVVSTDNARGEILPAVVPAFCSN